MSDDRLYAKFTLDFPDHPKILCLSVEAKWALVEMTIYSRRHLTDGWLSKRVALAKWGLDVCSELATNDDAKPSLIESEDGYQIHDFARHQSTKAQIEDIREKRRAAGSKGGQARAKHLLEQNGSKIKPETETETSSSKEEESPKREDVEELLDLLEGLIVANGSKAPARNQSNRDAARLMLDKDGRSFEQVAAAIRWSQQDSFWRTNVLSMTKLRDKYDQLRLAAQHDREKQQKAAPVDVVKPKRRFVAHAD